LPEGTTLQVPVAGIDALDGPIARVAHRPQLVSQLTGRGMGEHLRPQDVALLLTHTQGGLKDAPATARVIPFINKVETEAELAAAEQIARLAAAHRRVQRVVVGAALHEDVVRLVVEGRETGP
jgi:probable selenium-dependent hydroxylase accessory protein YqeC